MWGWTLAALGVGGAFLYERSRPSFPTSTAVARSVQKAIASESDPAKLSDFAASLGTSYPTLSSALRVQAQILSNAKEGLQLEASGVLTPAKLIAMSYPKAS